MEKNVKKMRRQLHNFNEAKKHINVFDAAKNHPAYRVHKEVLLNIQSKIDNLPPIIGSANFFPQAKLQSSQRKLAHRLRTNQGLIDFLNIVQRMKGKKTVSFNPLAAHRQSKLHLRALELQEIDKRNRKISEVLREIESKIKTRDLNTDWQLIYRQEIIMKAKYAIVIDRVLISAYDAYLEDPPNCDEYKQSPKIFLDFCVADGETIGKIVIMLDSKRTPDIVQHFIDLCRSSYKGCKVYKIIKDLLIETGDIEANDGSGQGPENFLPIFPKSKSNDTQRLGTVSMLLNNDSLISSKFCISLKKMKMQEDGCQVVIGRVIKGLDVLSAIENFGSRFGVLRKSVVIRNCGLLK